MKGNLKFTLLLALFSGLVLSGGFLLQGSLYWDTSRIFPQFRDNLHALNFFGEIAWWLPHNQLGSPGYYHSILGIPSCVTPPFVLLGALCWVLGRLKIFITHFQPLYVFYFGFLIPTLFLLAVRAFALQLFKNPLLIRFILILAAFSPGVAFNLSDVGYLEPSIYGLYFGACVLAYIKLPKPKQFLALATSVLCLGLALNHAFLYWNLFFIPTFLSILFFIEYRRQSRSLSKALRKLVSPRVVALGLFFILGALPNLLTQFQGKELVRSSLGTGKIYPIEKLAAGSPLEMLTVSIPGFGFDWNENRTQWKLLPLSNSYHAAYYYLGLLCFPLILMGLLYGKGMLRLVFFSMVFFFFGVLPLSAHSPFFALLLALPTPLRSCNHFSDASFKAGSYLILIFAAAFGLRTVIQNRKHQPLLSVFLLSSLFSVATHLYISGKDVAQGLPFALLLFSILLFFIVLFWFCRADTALKSKQALSYLLLLSLFDVSNHSFSWVRNILNSQVILNSGWRAIHTIDETPSADGIGLKNGSDPHYYANTLLVLRPYFEMLLTHFNPYSLPPLHFYQKAHIAKDLPTEIALYVQKGATAYDSIALNSEMQNDPLFSAFFRDNNTKSDPIPRLRIKGRSYSSLSLEVDAKAPALLFIRDAYSPFWRAQIEGTPVPIARAFFNFKAIPIPSGQSSIELRFSPPGIGSSMLLAYLLLLGVFLMRALVSLEFNYFGSKKLRPAFESLD